MHKFKKTAQEVADKQKEKLRLYLDSSNEELPLPIRLFLACGDEMVRYFSLFSLLLEINQPKV